MKLSEYIQERTPLLLEDVMLLDNLFDYRELPKGSNNLNERSYASKVFFIEEGLMRIYYVKGWKYITHNFFTEDMFYMPIEKLFQGMNYPFSLELLEPCIIRTVEYDELKDFVFKNNKTLTFFFELMVDTIRKLSDRLSSIQFQSAQERYNIMMESYRNILLRAPLGHIASYLGITQQTLSVIRAEKSKPSK